MTVLYCAYCDIRIAIAARGIEAYEMCTSDLKKGDFDGISCYMVKATKSM